MIPTWRSAVLFLFLSLIPAGLLAQPKESTTTFVFGNSLVNHVSDDPRTNVPIWLADIARADGRSLKLDGEWGFMRDFANNLPATSNWSFEGVESAWNSEKTAFENAGFDSIILSPTNFIQYQSATRPFDGDNPSNVSPLSVTSQVFDWTNGQTTGMRHFIYEGWMDMGSLTSRFPPRSRVMRKYHSMNQGMYHDWYVDYVELLAKEHPTLDLRLIPVASTLSYLLRETRLREMSTVDLYVDDAPHGTASLYFLAALITYSALYETPPPAEMALPNTVHPSIRLNYSDIAQVIWEQVQPFTVPSNKQASTAAPEPIPQVTVETVAATVTPVKVTTSSDALKPEAQTKLPSLAMGLNGIADWSTQQPFVDLMKSARVWIGHTESQWGAMPAEELEDGGHLDDNGWIKKMPPGIDRVEAFLLTDQPKDSVSLKGNYILRYDGQGEISVIGMAKTRDQKPGEIRFAFSPGDGQIAVAIKSTDPTNYIRNIQIFKEDHLDLIEAGVLFNPAWIEKIHDLRSVRFMDWMFTNDSNVENWEQRARSGDYTFARRGVPLEVMVTLANEIGADPWFNMPHQANDDYVRAFASAVKSTLDPRLKAYVEYSNEVWNFIFQQAHYAQSMADDLWGETEAGWMQYYGLRAAQVMDIWTDVYGASAQDQLVRVVGVHTGWPGLEYSILAGEDAAATYGKPQRESFDAYAVTGYFGYEMGTDEYAGTIRRLLDDIDEEFEDEGRKQGLRRVALREFLRGKTYEKAYPTLQKALLEGSLRELTEEFFPAHAESAKRAGLRLIMYEGGTHVASHGALLNDERATKLFTGFNYSPEIAVVYEALLDGWEKAGGTLFNAFVDVANPTQWGSWGALRHLDDSNPRWDALMARNASGHGQWEQRDPAAFQNGVFQKGTAAADELTGSNEEDVLIAGDGDDTIFPKAGNDHVHGGAGIDLIVLPGNGTGYSFSQNGEMLIVTGPQGVVTMASVELVAFEEDPETLFDVSVIQ